MLKIRGTVSGLMFMAAAMIVNIGFALGSVQAQDMTLPEGTELQIVLMQNVSSKDANRGDAVNFAIDEDVMIDGAVVIKKGTPASGSVIYAEKGGYMGKSGKLAVQVEYTTTVDGESLRLSAAKGSEGNAKTGTVMALSIIGGPFALLKKGGNTVVQEGSKITVFTAESRTFRVDGETVSTIKPVTGIDESSGERDVTVYIYRPKKMMGMALEPSVYADGVELARMDNGRFFMLKLQPGKHVIQMTSDKKGYEFDMISGQTYYFRVGIEAGMWKGEGKILLEDEVKGAAEVKKLKPLDAEKIKDKTLVVTN